MLVLLATSVGLRGAGRRASDTIWSKARAETGGAHLHFHDLRHAGDTMAAATGVSVRELTPHMGHSSTRAALIYLHATSDRDRAIAQALGKLMGEHRASQDEPGDGGSDTQDAAG